VEVRWLVLVGAWKTCVTIDLHHATTPDRLSFVSWVREKCPLVCSSSAFPPLSNQHIIFSSSIVEDIMALRDAGRASIAYFYFDFRDVDKQKLQNLLLSLLIQLSAQSDSCCDILSRLYSTHNRGVLTPSDRAMIECLKEMLTREAQGPIYIIMDALDECPITSTIPSPREEVLELVEELVGLHLPNVHVCVTSRPERDIQIVLEPLTERPVSLHDESGQQEDITNYVSSFVRSNQRMRKWREEDKNLVIKALSEKADGM
jgi:NACHT domain-containing protein